ncbi:MAG: DUF3293 domain-containing protein [Zavarzinella sp.]
MQVGRGQILVSIATYNERENIQPLIERIHAHAPWADILVVDDNSPDGTGTLVDQLAAADARVKCLHRSGKLGLGTAILAAMRYAQENQYEFFLNMDADFSHPAEAIPNLVDGMANHDVMIGSRYVPGGGTQDWPWLREWISKNVNRLVRVLFRMPVRDASGGFRCYRVSMLRRVAFDKLSSRGYSFQQEMLYRCYRVGARIGEFPIIFVNRREGTSKVNLKETVRSLAMLLLLGIRSWFKLDRPRNLPVGQLAKAYKETIYWVDEIPGGAFPLQVGQHSPRLDALLQLCSKDEWAFVTAFNPLSKQLSPQENQANQVRLENTIKTRGWQYFRGRGGNRSSKWPPEPSFLIVGISASEAADLGREFAQQAILVGSTDSAVELLWLESNVK